jgi:hypothetical protein
MTVAQRNMAPLATREQLHRVVLRLSDEERETLKLLIAALKVSEYTDDVDAMSSYRREEKIKKATLEVFTMVIGLSHVAESLPKDLLSKLAGSYTVRDLEPVLANTFEIARRFKRFNPDKMRSEYGKLVMMMQDLYCYRLGFEFKAIVTPVKTVGSTLDAIGATAMLDDAQLRAAITPLPPRPSKEAIDAKAEARAALLARYAGTADDSSPTGTNPATPTTTDASPSASPRELLPERSEQSKRRELVDRCIKSLDDAMSFIDMNVKPIDRLLKWLDEFRESESTASLAIASGKGGACLSHTHKQQIGYVREALSLWREIHENIFDFWETVEHDMVLSGTGYRWRNTGQGFHRVSSGPETYRRIKEAISVTQGRLGGWVGSQVVHLGDDDVPNPLVFIDKYTGIPNYLAPIVLTIDSVADMFNCAEEPYPGIRQLILTKCKSPEELKRGVLRDLFRHGFDGSGDDGGSCIDGRLTSLWNWSSLLYKKTYYPVFQLTGFNGFDANFN